jgi:hypothetical protein
MYPTPDGLAIEPSGSFAYRAAAPDVSLEGRQVPKSLEYPLYAFFLHTEEDKEVADYLSQNGPWLDALTGGDCLICTFEKPSSWDEGWKAAWQKRLGPDFEKNYAKWDSLTAFTRNSKVKTLADCLNVPINHMPCMVFIEDLHSHRILQIPFIANKDDYGRYFKDVLTCVQMAAGAKQTERLSTLESKWRKYWIKWIVPQKAKVYAKSIQEWGSLISYTKDELVKVLDFVSPIIKQVGLR